jgi:hypothetical protein
MNKEEQKQLIIDIMNEDARDGLYKQQTAVEWLENELSKIGLTHEVIGDKIQKAKEMEKEQIIDAWIATDNELQRLSAEQYYKKTYGGKK